MRITALSCLSIVVGACADPPALGEHATAATVGDYETTSCSTAVVLELSRQIAGEVGCMAPGQLVTFPEGNGLVFTGGAGAGADHRAVVVEVEPDRRDLELVAVDPHRRDGEGGDRHARLGRALRRAAGPR